MKKFFTLAVLFALVWAGCSQFGENIPGNKPPTITIKNESSYALTNVKFMGLDFYIFGTNDLPVSSQAVQQITPDLIDKSGYITFSLKETPGAACRTNEVITVSSSNLTFTFLDTTIVEELSNSNNNRLLSQITFSRIGIQREGRSVVKNDIVPLGETAINYISQHEFSIKNTGVGKLKLTGNEPVKINGSNDVFSIIQPASSEINSNGILTFKVNFNPKAIQPYSTQITVCSNDQNGDFMFTVMAVGTTPKPIAIITYGTNDIAQNDTINIGDVFITQSKNISVIIKNTGTEVLTIEPENITITGSDAEAFTKLTNPSGNISINSQTSFSIEFKPITLGENNAILTIPTNDNSRNPITVFLKVTGIKGSPVLELSQGTTVIINNSLTPFNFGQVDLGTDKPLVFTIKNTGNIALELTGTPTVESSNSVFSVSTQPANRALIPGTTTSFIIKYTPTTEGEDTGSITIANNSDAMVFTINVKGTGYVKKPQINILQGTATIAQYSEYNFGTTSAGKTKDIVFTIKNSGDANLTFVTVNNNRINLTDNTGAHFTVTQQPSAGTVVTPGSTSTFTLRFKPTLIGDNFTANVQIKTNSRTNNEFSFWVKGNGSGYNIGDTGPGGGLIFYAQGGQFKECSAELGSYSWSNAITAALNYQGGGFTNWRLPDKDELNLMYQNLCRNSNVGAFATSSTNVSSAYWSSSEYNSSYAWFQLFSNGIRYYTYSYSITVASVARAPILPPVTIGKSSSLRVRAVRTFSF